MPTEIQYRTLNFISECGDFSRTLTPIWYAFVCFPEDETSRAQALEVYRIEASKYHADPSKYEVSQLVEAISNSIRMKVGQRSVAGLTMLAFQYLFMKNREDVSLYRAAQVVERAIDQTTRIGEEPFVYVQYKNSGLTPSAIRFPKSRRDIEKAYKAHESIAHILAAELLCSPSFVLDIMFERTFEMDSVLLNTASQIERVMLTRQPNHFHDPWLVTPALNEDIRSCGHVEFDGDIVALIERGLK